GKRLFRRGAIVNVIFVSDTHDPGRGGAPAQELIAKIPTYDALVEKVEKDNDLAGLKFHGLVPDKGCTSEAMYNFTYHALIDPSGGKKQHPCGLDDYSGFVKDMVENGKMPQKAVFSLSKPAKDILEVNVDGKKVTDF